MSRKMINAKLELIAAQARVMADENGRWYVDDLLSVMTRIITLAEDVKMDADKLLGGDR